MRKSTGSRAAILITGSTGHLGAAVIEQLLTKIPAAQIAALARDESRASALKERGVDVRVGSYDDADSLDEAARGIETLLLIAGTDERNRLRQHQNVIDAAKKAGVNRIAYTSRSLRSRSTLVNALMEGHFQTEDAIRESGMAHTIFRNALYMDTIPQFVGGTKVFETGILLPAGEGRVAYALRSEMGEAIANVLLSGNDGNRIYTFTGSEACSFGDVAAELSQESGRDVKYLPSEKATFEAQMRERGTPEAVIQKVVGFLTDIANGQESEVTRDLEQQLGRRPAPLRGGLRTLFAL